MITMKHQSKGSIVPGKCIQQFLFLACCMCLQYCKRFWTVSSFRLQDWTTRGSVLHAESPADTKLLGCFLFVIPDRVIWRCYRGRELVLRVSACTFSLIIEQRSWDLAYLGRGRCALKLLSSISCFFNIANEAKSLPLNHSINYLVLVRSWQILLHFLAFSLAFALYFCRMHCVFCDLFCGEGREGGKFVNLKAVLRVFNWH